jgi:hypothetical protein
MCALLLKSLPTASLNNEVVVWTPFSNYGCYDFQNAHRKQEYFKAAIQRLSLTLPGTRIQSAQKALEALQYAADLNHIAHGTTICRNLPTHRVTGGRNY